MISFRAVGTASSGTGTSASSTLPGAATPGDLLLLAVTSNAAATPTTPAGWTLLRSTYNATGSTPAIHTFYRIMQNGDAAPSVTFSGSVTWKSAIMAFSGVDATSPFVGYSEVTPNGSITFPSVTSPLNCVSVLVEGQTTNVSHAPPSGWTEALDSNGLPTLWMAYNTAALAGASAPAVTSSGDSAAQQILFRPAQVPTFRAAGTQTQWTTTTSTGAIPLPAAQVGDLLIACLAVSGNGGVYNTITPPAGWTAIGSPMASGAGAGDLELVLFKRVYASGDSAPTFAIGGTGNSGSAIILSYAGAADADVLGTAGTASGAASVTAPSATTTLADEVLLAISVQGGNHAVPPSAPAGMTQDAAIQANNGIAVYREAFANVGATGSRTIAWSVTGQEVAVLLSLKPNTVRAKLRSVAKTNGASGTSLAVTVPPGTADGDLLICALCFGTTDPGTVTPPAGWTQIESQTAASPITKVFSKIASGEGATAGFSWVNTVVPTAITAAVSGGGNPEVDGTTQAASVANISWPSVTPTVPGDLLLLFGFSNSAGTVTLTTAPAGPVKVLDDPTTRTGFLLYEMSATASATGSRSGILSASDNNRGYVVAINPAPAAPTVTAPANNAALKLTDGVTVSWTFSDPGDTQSAFAIRRILANDDGTSAAPEWWDGGAWVGTETWITDSSSSVLLPGSSFPQSYYTYDLAVATKDSSGGASAYATVRVNPWEWWNGTSWVTTETYMTSTTDGVTAPAFASNGTYDWSVSTRDAAGSPSLYSASQSFIYGGGATERFGVVVI